jgi:Oxidoreductase molybdopterin binding domain
MLRLPLRLFCTMAVFGASCASLKDPAPAQPVGQIGNESAGTLHVDGDAGVRDLSIADLRALGEVEVAWTHKGNVRTFSAVPLEAVLRSFGVEPGEMASAPSTAEKRAAWKFAVVATATDGFQATFSVAEVFRGMGPTEAYVAVAEGGQPLSDESGPLRLVVPTDGEGSRSIHNLVRLTIVDLRRVVPAH